MTDSLSPSALARFMGIGATDDRLPRALDLAVQGVERFAGRQLTLEPDTSQRQAVLLTAASLLLCGQLDCPPQPSGIPPVARALALHGK